MAALMELPVKYIWTHDAFRVGEDGPTHEPVEQEAQIRLMEELRNFKGEPSMLVLRPGDAAETSVCWKMAMENTKTPTALILSRQDIPDLPAASGDRYAEALGAEKGGYIVSDVENPAVTLVANGSEVSLLVEVANILATEGIAARVVSVPSIGLFEIQPEEYRNSVIPVDGKVFGLTAGLPSTLRGVVGRNGEVFGLDHFGASAPYKVLDEKFGFTAPAVLALVKAYIKK
jgi:transketolase